jgi:glutaredoxin-like protein
VGDFATQECNMPESPLVVYGTHWCPDCIRARRFLRKHAIPFKWVNITKDEEGDRYVRKVNEGMRSVPTIVFPDGSILVEPSNRQLGEKLGVEDV